RVLLTFLLFLQALQNRALDLGQLGIADPQIGQLIREADDNAIRPYVSEEALNATVEQIENLFEPRNLRWIVERQFETSLINGADESVIDGERYTEGLLAPGPVAIPPAVFLMRR